MSDQQRVFRVNLKDIVQDCAFSGGLDLQTAEIQAAKAIEDSQHDIMLQLREDDA